MAKATSADLARLSRYGEYLGLAFQIADDMLDSHGGEFWHGSRVEPRGAEKVDLSIGCRNRRSSGAAQGLLSLPLVELENIWRRSGDSHWRRILEKESHGQYVAAVGRS